LATAAGFLNLILSGTAGLAFGFLKRSLMPVGFAVAMLREVQADGFVV
jgi:hypothetical protein